MVDFEEFIKDHIAHYMENVYTAFPAIIEKVDNENQKVNVKPAINYLFRDYSFQEYPVFTDVPLVFPASSTSAFTFPVNKGDTVLLVFSKKGITSFKAGDGSKVTTPHDFRSFDKRDAIAIPGLFPFKAAINKPNKRTNSHSALDTVVAHNIGKPSEAEIRIKPDGQVELNSPLKVVVNAPDAELNANTTITGTVTITGNVDVTGTLDATGLISSDTDVSSGTVTLKTHTHSGVTTGTGSSGPPVGA